MNIVIVIIHIQNSLHSFSVPNPTITSVYIVAIQHVFKQMLFISYILKTLFIHSQLFTTTLGYYCDFAPVGMTCCLCSWYHSVIRGKSFWGQGEERFSVPLLCELCVCLWQTTPEDRSVLCLTFWLMVFVSYM